VSEMARLLHDPAFYRLGLTLLHFLLQGTVLAVFAWAVRILLRRARPALRYLVLLALLLLMAAAPVVTFMRCAEPPAPALMTQPEMDRLLTEAARQRLDRAALAGAEAGTEGLTSPSITAPRRGRDPRLLAAGTWLRRAWRQLRMRLPMAGVLWVLGVALLSGQLLVQWALFARVVRWATPLVEEHLQQLLASLSARLGVRPAVRLLRSVEARTPVTAGWLRPVILLPPAVLLGLTPEQLEAVLAHELAHV
jgi:beta-lactamase regulating signal transducer with metallopeptidase domain